MRAVFTVSQFIKKYKSPDKLIITENEREAFLLVRNVLKKTQESISLVIKTFGQNFFAYSSSCLTLKKDEKLFGKSFSRSNKTQWSKINIFVHLIHLLLKIYLMHIFPNFNTLWGIAFSIFLFFFLFFLSSSSFSII